MESPPPRRSVHLVWLIVTVTVIAATIQAGSLVQKFGRTQRMSQAGQTLVDLRNALRTIKEDTGSYPESVHGIRIGSESGDFSRELLQRVIYIKTGDTYVAMVSTESAAFIRPDEDPTFVQ